MKKNILLEEKLKKLSEHFGVELTSPVAASEQLEDEEESPTNFPIKLKFNLEVKQVSELHSFPIPCTFT